MSIFSKLATANNDITSPIKPEKVKVIDLPTGRTISLGFGLRAIIIEREKDDSIKPI